MDETFIGGKPSNRHQQGKPSTKGKPHGRQGPSRKVPVVSIISEETGEVRSRVVPSVVGHNLYVEMTGDAGGHAIYRWVPEAPAPSGGAGAGGGGGSGGAYDAVAQGHTAGIVLGVSVGLANLAFLYVLFVRTGGFNKLFVGSTQAPGAAYSAMEQGL